MNLEPSNRAEQRVKCDAISVSSFSKMLATYQTTNTFRALFNTHSVTMSIVEISMCSIFIAVETYLLNSFFEAFNYTKNKLETDTVKYDVRASIKVY